VGRITKALPGELKRLLAWAGQWNPLAHALVVAFGLDLIADVFFGNADLNGAVFVVTFVAVLAASIVLQRRADTRRYDALPFSPGAPMDSDGVELELVAFAWTDPDRKEQKEMIWARPVDDDLFRIRSVPSEPGSYPWLLEIGDFMGDSSAYMVDRYRHLLDGQREQAAGRLDAYLAGAQTGAQAR